MLVQNYIPENLKNLPLFIEIADDLQRELDLTVIDLDDIAEKYLQRGRNVDLLFSEFGYGYVTDLFTKFEYAGVEKLDAFLALLHALKGSQEGISIIARLLVDSAKLVEWWDASSSLNTFGTTNDPGTATNQFLYTTNVVPDTYTLDATIITTAFTTAAYQAFRDFSPQYVMPRLLLFFLRTFAEDATDVRLSTESDALVLSDLEAPVGWRSLTSANCTTNSSFLTNSVSTQGGVVSFPCTTGVPWGAATDTVVLSSVTQSFSETAQLPTGVSSVLSATNNAGILTNSSLMSYSNADAVVDVLSAAVLISAATTVNTLVFDTAGGYTGSSFLTNSGVHTNVYSTATVVTTIPAVYEQQVISTTVI